MVKNKLSWFVPGSVRWNGPMDHYVRFAMEHQLLNEKTWADFVEVFRADSDDHDTGWRGEYWGKMMRGACMIYHYNHDAGLYAILERTVRDMLTAQRSEGRFSTYSAEKQFNGWDMWARKYVLTSMIHFHDICQDDSLKAAILEALCRHMDAIVAHVGPGPEQTPITQTSSWWGGVNSASILDAVLELYERTDKVAYLEFARYILSTGGCADGNLIDLALEDEKKPYQYPTVKAYETMSFFEGVLHYYTLTGERKYLQAVLNFVEAVNETDITIIGCSGCTHELFDHSAVRQIFFSEGIMQETCVTVTWMRLLQKLFLLTGEGKYVARIEHSAYNALYGSTNTHGLKQLSMEEKQYVDPLPFDSYSPLYNSSRGRGIGGFKRFSFGGYYGCCACIASAGIAVLPLVSALQTENGISVNSFAAGSLTAFTPDGNRFSLSMASSFPTEGKWSATFETKSSERFCVRVRIPGYLRDPVIRVNGTVLEVPVSDGFAEVDRQWSNGDVLDVFGTMILVTHTVGDKKAFSYGPLVLARDSEKEPGMDITAPFVPLGEPKLLSASSAYGELLRISLSTQDGEEVLLTDYASCGKNWLGSNTRITVWMNVS